MRWTNGSEWSECGDLDHFRISTVVSLRGCGRLSLRVMHIADSYHLGASAWRADSHQGTGSRVVMAQSTRAQSIGRHMHHVHVEEIEHRHRLVLRDVATPKKLGGHEGEATDVWTAQVVTDMARSSELHVLCWTRETLCWS